MKVREWLPVWLENYVKPTAKEKTYVRYAEIVKQHLIPHIGELEMSEVTPLMLQQMVTELSAHGNLRTGGGLSANTVNAIVTVIQVALQVAYRLGYLPEYTADKVKRPKAAEKQVECFTVEEQKKSKQRHLPTGARRCSESCFVFTPGCASGNCSRLSGRMWIFQGVS